MRLGGTDQHHGALTALKALDGVDARDTRHGVEERRRCGRDQGADGIGNCRPLHAMRDDDTITGVPIETVGNQELQDVGDQRDLEGIARVAAVFVVGNQDHGSGGVEDCPQERIEGYDGVEPVADGGMVGDTVAMVDDRLEEGGDFLGHPA